MKHPTRFVANLSVKVTPEFEAQVRAEAAQRKVNISVVLRERLGIETLPDTETSPRPLQAVNPPTLKAVRRRRRPTHLASVGGSDPVVVRLLASVANGLGQTAQAIADHGATADAAAAANWLGALQSMDARLAHLIEHEERKNAH